MEETCVISATRNADLTFDTEKFEDSEDDFRLLMTKLLKRRAQPVPCPPGAGQRPSQEMLALLERVIQVETHQIYYDSAPLSMGYVYDLEKALSPDLRARLTYPAYHPRWPEDLNRQESMIEQIRRKDRLLFFPFDSIDPFLRLLEGGGGPARRGLHQDHHLPPGLHLQDCPDSLPGGGERERGGGPHGASGSV